MILYEREPPHLEKQTQKTPADLRKFNYLRKSKTALVKYVE